MSEVIDTPVGPAALNRTDRKTLAISVHPNGSLELVAPRDAALADILLKITKRRKWILTQRRKFLSMNVTRAEPRYVTGATHRYLGRQYRLKISRGNQPGVSLKGAYFHITVKGDECTEAKVLLNKWFRSKAKEQFAKRVDAWVPWCKKHHLPEPRMRILMMLKRWGSAGQDGRIALNPELIHAPSRCIDYVIVHEICHLRHTNHDRSFYRLISTLLPGWKELKKRLEESSI
jgi:predicted metal-dependent hydrolase